MFGVRSIEKTSYIYMENLQIKINENKDISWVRTENMKKVDYLCLSDDIDSLFSCIILRDLFPNLSIGAFYNFDQLYSKENAKFDKYVIGVDMDIIKGHAFGNHVTKISKKDTYNTKCFNLNNIYNISRENYYQKYCGSTLLTIISLYNVDINSLNDEAKIGLLAIDSTYMGYYFNNGYYCKKYLKELELDCLIDILEKYPKYKFQETIRKYNLTEKIYINKEGKLTTKIDLIGLSELFGLPFIMPKAKFNKCCSYNSKVKNINYNITKNDLKEDIFSFVLSRKNLIKYSVKGIRF